MNSGNSQEVLQNLKDAGCSDQFIDEFFRLIKQNESKKSIIKSLYKYKEVLLKSLHDYQKKIDCLDFLIYKINQTVNK